MPARLKASASASTRGESRDGEAVVHVAGLDQMPGLDGGEADHAGGIAQPLGEDFFLHHVVLEGQRGLDAVLEAVGAFERGVGVLALDAEDQVVELALGVFWIGHGGERRADDVLAADAGELQTVPADGVRMRRAGDERDFLPGQRQRGAEYRTQSARAQHANSHRRLLFDCGVPAVSRSRRGAGRGSR